MGQGNCFFPVNKEEKKLEEDEEMEEVENEDKEEEDKDDEITTTMKSPTAMQQSFQYQGVGKE